MQFAITRFEAGAPPACMPSCFFFFCAFKVSHSLETQDLEPMQLNVMEMTVVEIWEQASQGHEPV